MPRLGLLAVSFLAALMGAAAQAPPACAGVSVALKASKTVRLGGATSATFSVQNTGSSTQTDLIVGITLPPQYQKPHNMAMRSGKPKVAAQYLAPSTVWTPVTIPPRKTLRFTVKAKLNKCQSYASTLQINAAAYRVDGSSNLVCYSGVNPATVTVRPNNKAVACPTPAPGPGGPVQLVAENQAFAGADPFRRRLAGRELEASSLEECTTICGETYAKPYFVVYNDNTGACSCCQDTCGALVVSPGSNVYEVLAPPPSPGPGPAPGPSPGPGPSPTPAPYTLCKTGGSCVPASGEDAGLASITACKDLCISRSASNKFIAYASNGGFCMCSTSYGTCNSDAMFNTYAVNGGVCPPE